MAQWYHFDHLLAADGWRSPAFLKCSWDGNIADIRASAPEGVPVTHVAGYAIPGLPNLHSHAIQRAMAGLAETAGASEESFWTWRDVMYDFVERLTPEQIEAIAAQLYVEMLKAGYTSVAEFHYLHHGPSGQPYAQRDETSRRIVSAAGEAGIGLTLLPVLYAHGGFGGQPLGTAQRRFGNDVEGFLGIVEAAMAVTDPLPGIRVGIAPHSLRAVSPELLRDTLDGAQYLDPSMPVHIHIAEQAREVDDCLAALGKRPVEWLLDEIGPDHRWCLVHATHLSGQEQQRLASGDAVVGLCPTTEANLGDGVFPFNRFLEDGGRFGIGSDSNISIDPSEELRWLHYTQRLASHSRGLNSPTNANLGETLYQAACLGGAQALGQSVGQLDVGRRADIVVLDAEHPGLCERPVERLLDAHVFFNAGTTPVRDVIAGGSWVVRDRAHRFENDISRRFLAVMKTLRAR